MGLENVNGGQGGDINALCEMWHPILRLGLLRSFGHSYHSCVSSSSVMCGGMGLRWFGHDDMYVTISGLASLFVYSVWLSCILLIVASSLCCRLQGVTKIVSHGSWVALRKNHTHSGKPALTSFKLVPSFA